VTPTLLARERRFTLPDPTLPAPERVPFGIVERGACTTASEPGVFDIDDHQEDPFGAAQARALCRECPVRQMCLDYAMANEAFGIWGGLDAFERLEQRGAPLPDADERHAAESVRVRLRTGTPATTIAAEYGVTRRTIERWKRAAGIRVCSQQPEAAAAECDLAA
jgi:WhiB family redox-sensing transcriptional regulator